MRLSPTIALAAFACLASSACVLGPEPVFARNVAEGSYCASPHARDGESSHAPPEAASSPASAAAMSRFSPRALDMARAIGALAQVERLADAEARHASDAEMADLRGQLNDAVQTATLDLASMVAHLECAEGRATQIASDLRKAEQTQTKRLTAYSLVLSALGAIGAAALAVADKDQTPAAVVGITGGVTGGAFGLATLAVHRTTTFRHERNVLGQVWRGDAHPDIPEVVWAYLSRAQFTKSGARSYRDHLVVTWKESGRLGESDHVDAARVALYFGDGGVYDADGLDDYAGMLSDVREIVDLMHHDLAHLSIEAARR
jgi:hypothetical protein